MRPRARGCVGACAGRTPRPGAAWVGGLARPLGFAPGLSLFPRELLGARGGTLKVIPTDTLEGARAGDQV